jgi:hypothetical protein
VDSLKKFKKTAALWAVMGVIASAGYIATTATAGRVIQSAIQTITNSQPRSLAVSQQAPVHFWRKVGTCPYSNVPITAKNVHRFLASRAGRQAAAQQGIPANVYRVMVSEARQPGKHHQTMKANTFFDSMTFCGGQVETNVVYTGANISVFVFSVAWKGSLYQLTVPFCGNTAAKIVKIRVKAPKPRPIKLVIAQAYAKANSNSGSSSTSSSPGCLASASAGASAGAWASAFSVGTSWAGMSKKTAARAKAKANARSNASTKTTCTSSTATVTQPVTTTVVNTTTTVPTTTVVTTTTPPTTTTTPPQHFTNLTCQGQEEVTGGGSSKLVCNVSNDNGAEISISAKVLSNPGNLLVSGIQCSSQGGSPTCKGAGTYEIRLGGVNDTTSPIYSELKVTATSNGVPSEPFDQVFKVDPSCSNFGC